MTVIACGNLPDFNFLTVDIWITHLNREQNPLGIGVKCRLCDLNNCAYTSCGTGHVLSAFHDFNVNFRNPNFEDINLRCECLEYITGYLSEEQNREGYYNPQPTKIIICYPNSVYIWRLIPMIASPYQFVEDSFEILNESSVRLIWFGNEASFINNNLTVDNVLTISWTELRRIHLVNRYAFRFRNTMFENLPLESSSSIIYNKQTHNWWTHFYRPL